MSSETQFCNQCGQAVPSLDSEFCSSCGNQLSAANPASSPTRETVVASNRKGSPFPRIILGVASFLFFPIGLIAGLWYMLNKKEMGFGGLLLGLGIISLLIIVVAPSDNASNTDDSTSSAAKTATKPTPTSTPAPTPPPSVNYHVLLAEREANATRFDANYKGKYVELTNAVVIAIESGDVRIAGPLGFLDDGVIQNLPTDVQIQLDKGMRISAVCKVGNFILGSMYFDSCILPISVG